MTNVLGLDDFVTEYMKNKESWYISRPSSILGIYYTLSAHFAVARVEESTQSHLRIYAARDKLHIN